MRSGKNDVRDVTIFLAMVGIEPPPTVTYVVRSVVE